MKIKNNFYFIILIILVLELSVCTVSPEKANKEQIVTKLQDSLQDALENPDTDFSGALLYIRSPEIGTWAGATGLSNMETASAMTPYNRFRAASILKLFIAVAILQLTEEARFLLTDSMTAVLPESVTANFSESSKITVRMLLNHTSGIPDWLTEGVMGEIAADPQRIWCVDEYINIAAAQELYFSPGESWRYSNTNYSLLGLVIEQATGRSWRGEIRERIIKPLKLENTRLPESGDLSVSDYHSRGYIDMGGRKADVTLIDSSMAGAAGGHALITTASDLARFLRAVLAGELFQRAGTLDEMMSFIDPPHDAGVLKYAVGYGLGVMRFLLPGNVEMFGHAGTTGGFQSFVYYLPVQNITVSGMMNNTESSQYHILLPALEILVPECAAERQ